MKGSGRVSGGGKGVGNEIHTLSSKSSKHGGVFADLGLPRGQLSPLRVKLSFLEGERGLKEEFGEKSCF